MFRAAAREALRTVSRQRGTQRSSKVVPKNPRRSMSGGGSIEEERGKTFGCRERSSSSSSSSSTIFAFIKGDLRLRSFLFFVHFVEEQSVARNKSPPLFRTRRLVDDFNKSSNTKKNIICKIACCCCKSRSIHRRSAREDLSLYTTK